MLARKKESQEFACAGVRARLNRSLVGAIASSATAVTRKDTYTTARVRNRIAAVPSRTPFDQTAIRRSCVHVAVNACMPPCAYLLEVITARTHQGRDQVDKKADRAHVHAHACVFATGMQHLVYEQRWQHAPPARKGRRKACQNAAAELSPGGGAGAAQF